jgi:TM2 domain-containing membrane protein YozV
MQTSNSHSKFIGYCLWFFGFLGAHRFYYGRPISGSFYFVASSICAAVTAFFFPLAIFIAPLAIILGVSWLIDLFLIPAFDNEADAKYQEGRINYNLAWLALTFLGLFGVHRFYMGKWISGLLYLCTGAFCGIGYLYDFGTLNEQIDSVNSKSN